MKLFVLKCVLYSTKCEANKVIMLTTTPDLVQATQELQNKLISNYGTDKGNMMPHIVSAELLPITYIEDKLKNLEEQCIV